MPQHLVDRLLASRGFNEGFATTEYLAAAVLDQAWHRSRRRRRRGRPMSRRSSATALAAAGLDDPLVPPRYSSTYFAHVFAGGYDAGYYSYIWSEVPGADIMAWFEAHGGATRENGDRFRAEILAPGGSRDPRDVDPGAARARADDRAAAAPARPRVRSRRMRRAPAARGDGDEARLPACGKLGVECVVV